MRTKSLHPAELSSLPGACLVAFPRESCWPGTGQCAQTHLLAVLAEDRGAAQQPQGLPTEQALREAVPHGVLPHVLQPLHQAPAGQRGTAEVTALQGKLPVLTPGQGTKHWDRAKQPNLPSLLHFPPP